MNWTPIDLVARINTITIWKLPTNVAVMAKRNLSINSGKNIDFLLFSVKVNAFQTGLKSNAKRRVTK